MVGVGGMVQEMVSEDQNIVVKNVLVNTADSDYGFGPDPEFRIADARQMVQWSVRCLP